MSVVRGLVEEQVRVGLSDPRVQLGVWHPDSIIANEFGDILVRPGIAFSVGHMSIEREYLEEALAKGWKLKDGGDEDYARIWRTAADRPR